VVLRAVTNVLLRDLNAGLIVEQMMAGKSSIFCDFTDYDEIAHHAGPTRPESMASLEGLDHLIGILQAAAGEAPRRYEFVVLSDHGQSQGATFKQRHGQTLEELIRQLIGSGATVAAATNLAETAGPANTLLSEVVQQGGTTGKVVGRSLGGRQVGDEVHLEDGAESAFGDPQGTGEAAPDIVVIASGNLAMVYFTRVGHRMTAAELEESYPGLVTALVDHPGIGYLVVLSRSHGTVVLGRGGANYLDEDRIEGRDPLADFGPDAAREVRRHAGLNHVGDLIINSPLDAGTDEVAAYEELVGCHGGLGGWQTQAVLLHPTAWTLDEEPLRGADAVHRQLVRWLRRICQRSDIADPVA
jgi:hypothetical protein